jgi:HD-GYP domain-containing protein (c-di-GMP phosphodiesterase class II)
MALVAGLAAAVGAVGYGLDAWPRVENDTIDMRFEVRGAEPLPHDVAIVAIDDQTFSALDLRWPFPRRLDADVIRTLHADGARAIAFDVQFTEPSDPTDDLRLFHAVGAARNVVLATTEVNASGQTDVLGGTANLRRAHAIAAAANLPADSGGVIRRYPDRMLGLPSFAVAAARVAGVRVDPARFHHDTALIDFRGPPGHFDTYSFSDVLRGRVRPNAFAGKIVVVGATAPTLQDLHPTSTTGSEPMSGAEVQANAIWTALHGNPLAPGPEWLVGLAILLCAGAAPLASLRVRVSSAAVIAGGTAAVYLALTQLVFDSGTVMSVSYPLAAWVVGTVGMVAGSYAAAASERNAFSRQLAASQLELVHRLAQAVESRDSETGEHVHRIGVLCRRLALQIGWSTAEAETIMHASIAHDIGKIGISDSVLLKPGRLDAVEWETMKTHTTIGANLLAGSPNPLIQMAEAIAISHHERWDGGGYPMGLKGEEIPLAGRICAIVDVYDALLSKRRYKDAWAPADVLAEIARASGTHFDPKLVDAFLEFAPGLVAELEASFAREETPDATASVTPGDVRETAAPATIASPWTTPR